MAWIILLFAGLLEVVWAVGLKYTHGYVLPQVLLQSSRLLRVWGY